MTSKWLASYAHISKALAWRSWRHGSLRDVVERPSRLGLSSALETSTRQINEHCRAILSPLEPSRCLPRSSSGPACSTADEQPDDSVGGTELNWGFFNDLTFRCTLAKPI